VSIATAKKRLIQRSKLPTGDSIVPIGCSRCATSILCWNTDPMVTGLYPYRVLCSYCRAAERAENVMRFGNKP